MINIGEWDEENTGTVGTLSDGSSFTGLNKVQPVKVSQATGFDVTSATFTQSFSFSSEDDLPLDIAFSSDGSKMFIAGDSNENVYEYSLSTNFDVTSASFTQSFDVSGQDGVPIGLVFNNDGSKMFIVGNNTANVYEYSLSTGFDVSTASFTQSFDVSGQDGAPLGLTFSTDGSKMFVVGDNNDSVFEYNLSTDFDISTATFTQSFSVTNQDDIPIGITFNNTGSKMFIVGYSSDSVYQYSLSTDFDISTATFTQSLGVSTEDDIPIGVAFNADGSEMFIPGDGSDNVYQYDIDTSANTGAGNADFSGPTWDNISSKDNIVVTESDKVTTRPYEVESLDTDTREAWIWVYGNWDSDDSDQIVIGAGSGDGTDYSVDGSGANPWGQTGINAAAVYHLNESSGSTIDSSPNGRDSTSTSGTTYGIEGELGLGRGFDGSDDTIKFPMPVNGGEDWTVVCTMLWNTVTDNNTIWAFDNISNTERLTLRSADGNWKMGSNGNTLGSGSLISTEEDYHTVVTNDDSASNLSLYLDGSQDYDVDPSDSGWMSGLDEFSTGGSVTSSSNFGDIENFSLRAYTEEKTDNWILAEFDASPKGGQIFFSWSGPTTAENIKIDSAAVITSTADPTTSISTATSTDTAAKATSTANLLTTTDTTSSTDNADQTTTTTQLITSTETTTTTDPATPTTATANLLTSSETTRATDTSVITVATATPLTSTEEAAFATITDDATITTVSARTLTSTESVAVTDASVITNSSAQVLTSDETRDAKEDAVTTTVSAIPLNTTSTSVANDSVETTRAAANVLTTQQNTSSTDNSRVTQVQAQALISQQTTSITDTAAVTQATVKILITEEFAPVTVIGPTTAVITSQNRFVDMQQHVFTVNDLADPLEATLKDRSKDETINLRTANKVTLKIKDRSNTTILDEKVNITDAENGEVEYSWSKGDTPIENIGVYRGKFKIFDGSGNPKSVPNDNFVTLETESDA